MNRRLFFANVAALMAMPHMLIQWVRPKHKDSLPTVRMLGTFTIEGVPPRYGDRMWQRCEWDVLLDPQYPLFVGGRKLHGKIRLAAQFHDERLENFQFTPLPETVVEVIPDARSVSFSQFNTHPDDNCYLGMVSNETLGAWRDKGCE